MKLQRQVKCAIVVSTTTHVDRWDQSRGSGVVSLLGCPTQSHMWLWVGQPKRLTTPDPRLYITDQNL